MNYLTRICFIIACLVALPSMAQWVWVDHDGRKVFSDRAPPLDVPEKDILKRYGAVRPNTDSQATGNTEVSPPQPAVSKPLGLDPKLAERKAKADQAEAAKRQAENAKVAQAKAENCARIKLAQVSLQSGSRISRMNLQGEKEFMNDAERSAELTRINNIMASDCR